MSTEWKLVPMHPTEEMIQATLDTGLYHDGEEAARAVLIDEYKAMVKAAPPAPQAASEPVATQAARDVLAERQRQISTEGYTPEHDDEHGAEEFGRAASVYANSHVYDVIGASYMGWPWDEAWYKPTTQRRNFVKAAALLLAGIECIDRATLPNGLTEAETSATASVAGLSGDAEREALIERLKAQSLAHRYEAETDSADLIDEAVAALHSTGKPDGEVRLTKEARVGHTTFGVGVPERFVIEAAQRAAEHPQGLVDKEAAAGLQRIIQENAERAAFLDSHPSVSAEMASLIEENERLRAATADAPVAEPVAVVGPTFQLLWTCSGPLFDHAKKHGIKIGTKLYTRAPAPEEGKDAARKPLTAQQIVDIAIASGPNYDGNAVGVYKFARAIEAAHGITDAAMAQGERG